ncbi:MAG TPA: glycoside hydrolase family 38 C-terminal domain-containing protein [Terriglobales bacterium]|nr:glycoside hydrolase family 38 C-terminal domain-containing protein [Terriglobales bacterium]
MPNDKENLPNQWSRREFVAGLAAAVLAGNLSAGAVDGTQREVFIVPNFHPASCGWLTTFSKERVYCANSYLSHLDRVRDDPNYSFVLSEVNNIIAIMEFQPNRIPELKQRIKEKRVELVNGYFLESAINLSGGEALVRQGVMGLRWYKKMFGVTPRFSWNIDVCGTHDQVPQIATGLGLEALVYCRKNPTGKTMYWSESPDGSRVLTLSPGHYSEAHPIFVSKSPLNDDELKELNKYFDAQNPITPEGAPVLILGGSGDYSVAPLVKEYPSLLQKQMADRKLHFTTLSQYLDAVIPGIQSERTKIPTLKGGTAYDFDAFWIENPRVKTLYRTNEHALQAAEALAAIASLKGKYEYPIGPLSNCWILMCLNMDRNTIWGSAGGMVFENEKSWDALDRFNWVNKTTDEVFTAAGSSVNDAGDQIGLFNPLNWKRTDPVVLKLPQGQSLEGTLCEGLSDGTVLCRPDLASMSIKGLKISPQGPASPRTVDMPAVIETKHYSVVIDSKTGAITSLKLKKSERELLAAPANVIVAERPTAKMTSDPGDMMPARPQRTRLATSSDQPSTIQVKQGPLATTVEVTGSFYGGGTLRRVARFYNDHPRIDFETELNDVPNFTVVVSEFPLADDILEVRRAIPYGFSHGAWSKPNANPHGWTKGIVPAVRWIDFSLSNGGGFAILDRGLSGRELNDRTPIIFLLNAEDKYAGYENAWLSGKGRHVLEYSIVPRDGDWKDACIPQMAWEYNRAPVVIGSPTSSASQSFLETSENVIVEGFRRESDHIEIRLVECLGLPGTAKVKLDLPHRNAMLTDLTGRKLSTLAESSPYSFPVRPQQIVTLHFATASALPEAEPVKSWDAFVPKQKLPALHAYDPNLIGHPPFGG